MKHKDIIFVSNSLDGGGAARVLCLLANHFQASGREVGVLIARRNHVEYFLSEGIEKAYGPSGRSAKDRVRRLRWLRRSIRQSPRATVIAFEYFVNIETLVACAGLSNRVIVSERNDPSRVGNGFPQDAVRKLLYRWAHTLVCQTDEAAAYFSDRVSKRIILNPINSDLPQPALSDRRKTVVTFCRLEAQKNLPMLIRAFAEFHRRHPDYSLEIYGDGREQEALTEMIASLSMGGNAFVYPARTDIHEVVRDCAMFVLPSDYEGLSNSMLEAMALGLPTICTDCPCGGARMVIEDGNNGVLVPVGDQESLLNAMTLIASDPDLAREMGSNATAIRVTLSLETIASQWESLLPVEGVA